MATGAGLEQESVHLLLRKVSGILLPLIFLATMLSYLVRSNLSFAALDLNADLALSSSDYGFASGYFFLGYGIFMIPSTYTAMRHGSRWWFGAITVSWGIVAACSALIQNATSLYVLRFLLGATQSGAASISWHLIGLFYPDSSLAMPYAVMNLATVVSAVLSGPLAAGLLSLHGVAGISGWRWLFFIEAIPSIILGVAMWVWLPSDPLTAWMLSQEEGETLNRQVHKTSAAVEAARHPLQWHQLLGLMGQTVRLKVFLFMNIIGFLWVLTAFSLYAWLPIIIKNMLSGTALAYSSSSGGTGAHNTSAILLATIPFFCAACSMVAVAWRADKAQERNFHFAVPFLLGGVVLACFAPLYRISFIAGFVVLAITATCAYGGQSVMIARTAICLTPRTAGVGLSIFNAVCAALGGFVGPIIVGQLVEQLGGFSAATVAMGLVLALAGCLGLGLGWYECRQARRAASEPDQTV